MFCPKCGKNLKFDEQHLQWYCMCGFNGIPENMVKSNDKFYDRVSEELY